MKSRGLQLIQETVMCSLNLLEYRAAWLIPPCGEHFWDSGKVYHRIAWGCQSLWIWKMESPGDSRLSDNRGRFEVLLEGHNE